MNTKEADADVYIELHRIMSEESKDKNPKPMKANELMIGDLLRYKQDFPHTHFQGKIVKVCGIRGRVDVRTINDGFFHESEHPAWLEPIPLTPEILEKNGFIYKKLKGVGDNEIWRIEDDYYDIDIYEWSDSIWIFRYDCNEMSLPHTQVTMSYVHELRHALRLCGIEKDIEL